MSSASDNVVEDTQFVGTGSYFLALRASGCAGLGNRHTGQGVRQATDPSEAGTMME